MIGKDVCGGYFIITKLEILHATSWVLEIIIVISTHPATTQTNSLKLLQELSLIAMGIWTMFGRCLEHVWNVSRIYLEVVWKVGRCTRGFLGYKYTRIPLWKHVGMQLCK